VKNDGQEGRYDWADAPQTAFPIARPGKGVILSLAFVTAIFAVLGLRGLSLASLAACGFSACFFRDPDRLVPRGEGAVVSPADGRVLAAGRVEEGCACIPGPCLKVSIFMSLFNVHVNRIPHEGKVVRVDYHPGKFVSASFDKASEKNERNAVLLETPAGKRLCFVQVAGLIARRIICGLQAGDVVERGRRFGMICFGSRLDVYLPPDARLKVAPRERVKAGTSVLGYLK